MLKGSHALLAATVLLAACVCAAQKSTEEEMCEITRDLARCARKRTPAVKEACEKDAEERRKDLQDRTAKTGQAETSYYGRGGHKDPEEHESYDAAGGYHKHHKLVDPGQCHHDGDGYGKYDHLPASTTDFYDTFLAIRWNGTAVVPGSVTRFYYEANIDPATTADQVPANWEYYFEERAYWSAPKEGPALTIVRGTTSAPLELTIRGLWGNPVGPYSLYSNYFGVYAYGATQLDTCFSGTLKNIQDHAICRYEFPGVVTRTGKIVLDEDHPFVQYYTTPHSVRQLSNQGLDPVSAGFTWQHRPVTFRCKFD